MGHTTHGLALLPGYLDGLEGRRHGRAGEPEVVRDTGACLTWDGRRTARRLAHRARDRRRRPRARQYGTATVVVRRSHHIACLGAFLTRATDQGLMIILASSDPADASVAPFGGTSAVFTPDPIAVGIPTEGDPILIDTSASITTNGMSARLRRRGPPVPPCVAARRGRRPDRRPARCCSPSRRAPSCPTGGLDHGHKGYGLALMIEALTHGPGRLRPGRAGRRAGAPRCSSRSSTPRPSPGGRPSPRRPTGSPRPAAPRRPGPGVERVRLPGEAALARRRRALAEGVELYPASWRGWRRERSGSAWRCRSGGTRRRRADRTYSLRSSRRSRHVARKRAGFDLREAHAARLDRSASDRAGAERRMAPRIAPTAVAAVGLLTVTLPALAAPQAPNQAALQRQLDQLQQLLKQQQQTIDALQQQVQQLQGQQTQSQQAVRREQEGRGDSPGGGAAAGGPDRPQEHQAGALGFIDRAVNIAADGKNTKAYFVDNNNANSRFRLDGTYSRPRTPPSAPPSRSRSGRTTRRGEPDRREPRRQLRRTQGRGLRQEQDVGRPLPRQGDPSAKDITRIDLSDTDLLNYASVGDIAGGLLFAQDDAYTTTDVSSAFTDFDPGRQNRVRYDTPVFAGLTASRT